MTTVSDPDVEVREGTYGDKVIAVEPGGAEFIPLNERHGRPLQLFWTWTSPNMEFATVFVGFIGVVFFGLSFWATLLAILMSIPICVIALIPSGAVSGGLYSVLRVISALFPFRPALDAFNSALGRSGGIGLPLLHLADAGRCIMT